MKYWDHFHSVKELFATALTGNQAWAWVTGVAAAIWAWLAPTEATQVVLGALWLLVLLDFVTGVRASIKKKRFIRSKLWNRILDKSVAYGSISVLALVGAKYGHQYQLALGVIYLVLTLIASGELISVFENLNDLGVPYAGRIAKALKLRAGQIAEEVEEKLSGGALGEKADG